MSLLKTVDRGAVRVITYANPPFGTMTAAGSTEMFNAIVAAGEDQSVRVVIITGGLPGIFIRHYDVGELSDRQTRFTAEHRATPHSRILDRQVFTRLRI